MKINTDELSIVCEFLDYKDFIKIPILNKEFNERTKKFQKIRELKRKEYKLVKRYGETFVNILKNDTDYDKKLSSNQYDYLDNDYENGVKLGLKIINIYYNHIFSDKFKWNIDVYISIYDILYHYRTSRAYTDIILRYNYLYYENVSKYQTITEKQTDFFKKVTTVSSKMYDRILKENIERHLNIDRYVY
jgi:hypothetical protein